MYTNLMSFLAVTALVTAILAQGSKQAGGSVPTSTPTKPPLQTTPPPIEAAFLKITIDPSRSAISMDTEAGLSAEIKNVSAVPVRLYENETVFMTMPETRVYGETKPGIRGCATFPTQGNVRATVRPPRGYDLIIQPGDSYRVFWDFATNGCTGERQQKTRFWDHPLLWFEEKWQRMMFTPGTYKVYLDVVHYPQDQQPYHASTEGHDVIISASQQMVLLGAFLGGLLAYVIKLYYGVQSQLTVKMQDALPKRLIEKTEWLVAGLFGAGMVILFSRLSDTFPVKVNANDFFGSITLGFVFQWIGVKLLEKLPGMGPTNTTPAPPPTITPAPHVGP